MLIVFDLAFIVRVILNLTIWPSAYGGLDGTFKFYMATIAPGILVDVLPVVGVMWLHHNSFKKGILSDEDSLSLSLDSQVTSTV